MTEPKPFQKATVKAAVSVLGEQTGPRRFLVADEVGLGKTIVAQHVIAELAKGRDRPLVIYYVCSSLTIASQNTKKLVEAVDADEEIQSALCRADRLSMLPFEERPSHSKVHLYTLTPDTSLPARKGKRRDGRKEERALLHCLLEQCWPGLVKRRVLKRGATKHWNKTLRWARGKLDELRRSRDLSIKQLRSLFETRVMTQLDVASKREARETIKEYLVSNVAQLELIGLLRTALVECTFEMEGLQPDLVIFDEFQRFRDLVKPSVALHSDDEEAVEPIVAQLRGDNAASVAVLLLSATPYSLYNRRDEEEVFGAHHEQLLELLCFLYGDGTHGKREALKAERLLKKFGDLIRAPEHDFSALDSTKKAVERQLRRVLSRTERNRFETVLNNELQEANSRMHVDEEESPRRIEVTTEEADWKVFRHLSERLPGKYRGTAVTYWRSIPFPMQTMGSGYLAWREANRQRPGGKGRVPAFKKLDWERHKKVQWPHAKLRALVDQVSPSTLCLPWIPPSLPWWKLGKVWQSHEANQGKVLLFSRFRATPKAVAAALSHEARSYSAKLGKLRETGSTLPLTSERMPIVALFYPSLWLAMSCEPLTAVGETPAKVRRIVTRQLESSLKEAGIRVVNKGSKREAWRLLAALDARLAPVGGHGIDRHTSDREVSKKWAKAAATDVSVVSRDELDNLAGLALGGPGVVLTRSLSRHYPKDNLTEVFNKLLTLSLHLLRNYFDNSVFVAAIRRKKPSYPKALQREVFEGNLEAVLDEHIWFMRQGGVKGLTSALASLSDSLGVRGGRVAFHHPDNNEVSFRAQCDVALPLAQEVEQQVASGESTPPLRTDQVRKAFNSPFWPFVLTTTSVGQEGLDFHPWCQTLVHWDLPGNPVDLEQREGRIQRYAGLSVRRGIAADCKDEGIAEISSGESPWKIMEKIVNKRVGSDGSGLSPWWTYPGASVKSLFFHLPASEEDVYLTDLKKQRAVYRLALGQQHQEDFVRILRAKGENDLKKLMDSTPNLAAWWHQRE